MSNYDHFLRIKQPFVAHTQSELLTFKLRPATTATTTTLPNEMNQT